ncbi:MAG: hypothetical protein ACREHG_02365, partial [Candidatus Saccharimonadales bacterium]
MAGSNHAARKNNSKIWADFIYQDIICRFGCIPQITCNGGSEFKGITRELMERYHIPIVISSPYHPQGNGQMERAHAPLVNAILKCC